jgi:hypothetical protein
VQSMVGMKTWAGMPGARCMGVLAAATMLAWCAQASAQEPLDEARFLQLQACLDLPGEQRLACVEPLVGELPPTIARGFREQADPAWRAMVERQAQAWDEAMSRHAHALAAAGGARNLAAAALLLPDQRPVPWDRPQDRPRVDVAAAWYAQAQAQGADDALLVQIDLSACEEFRTDCPPWPERVGRAIALAPGEGAHRLMALGVAARQDNSDEMRAHLAAAARSPDLDHGAYGFLRFMANATQAMAPPEFAFSEEERRAFPDFVREQGDNGEGYPATWILGRWSAFVGPSPKALFQTCGFGPGALEVDAATRADCIAVLSRIVDEMPTMLGNMIALPRLVELSEGSDRQEYWRERQRRFAWLRSQAYPLHAQPPMLPVAEHFELLLESGEVAAVEAALRRARIDPEPPAGWQPAEE